MPNSTSRSEITDRAYGTRSAGEVSPRAGFGRIGGYVQYALRHDLYEVALVSYDLDDLSDDLGVQIGADETLELTFDDGTSLGINVVITVVG